MDLGCCLPLLAPAFRERLLGYLVPRELPAGTAIVREGERTAEMFFVVAGSARIRRDDLDVGTVGPGDHFGELGLLASLPRSASVVAGTPISLLSLDEDAYARLARDEPQLALSLVHVLVGGLAERLGEMTDRVSSLLRERSLPRRASVEVRTDGTTRRVATGTPAGSLLPRSIDGHPVVGALVARKPVSLDTPIASDASLAPITTAHWEGERIRRASLGLLLLEAARQVAPGAVRRLGPSQGGVQLVEITPGREGEGVDLHRLAETLAGAMRALVAADQPFLHEWWTVEEASAYFHEQGSADTTLLLQVWREAMVPLVSCGETRAISFGPVVPRTRDVGPFQLEADREGIYLVTSPTSPGSAGRHGRVVRPAAEAMTSEHARWLAALGVTSVGAFNARVRRRRGDPAGPRRRGLPREAHRRASPTTIASRRRSRDASSASPGRRRRARPPSSSGSRCSSRSTASYPLALSLDDYYVDREQDAARRARRVRLRGARGARPRAPPRRTLGRLLRGESVRTAALRLPRRQEPPRAAGPSSARARPGAAARGHPRPQPGSSATACASDAGVPDLHPAR